MSLIAISLAIKARLDDPLAKFLLVLLSDRHNSDTGDCFPSINRLTEDSAMSRATVLRKLAILEDKGLIARVERRRDNGSRASTAYNLLFVPGSHSETGVGSHSDPPNRKLTTASFPTDIWRPSEASITAIKTRYPHHDTSPEVIDYLVREWVAYCHSNGKKYVAFDAAWRNSAERYLRRQSARPSAIGAGGYKRGGAGALSEAIRRSVGNG
jgi:hypothetical protein